MIAIDKTEVLKRFEFMQDIYNKVDAEDSTEELCGVFFYEGKAYTTNNHIIGRLSDSKGFPSKELMFWSYHKGQSCKVGNEWPKLKLKAIANFRENFVGNLDQIFDSYADNYFFVKKEDIISILSEHCKTDGQKARTFVHIKIERLFLKFSFFNKRGKVLSTSLIPLLTNYSKTSRIMHGCSFSVNVLYLFKVTFHSFLNCDIIGFKLKEDDYQHPVIVFNKHNSLNRPKIHWSIAQTLLKIK